MLNILLHNELPPLYCDALKNKFLKHPQINFLPNNDLAQQAENAHIIITFKYNRIIFPHTENLQLVLVPGVGLDQIQFEDLSKHIKLCNTPGHETALAEYALSSMLTWNMKFHTISQHFKADGWNMNKQLLLHSELSNKTVGIVGLGAVGQAILKTLAGFNTRVLAYTQSPKKDFRPSQNLQVYYPTDNWDNFVTEVDFLIICCAYNEKTHHLIDKKIFQLMKKTAVVINISRGACVKETDLYEVCKNKTIAGAFIDVWYNYPTEKEHIPAPANLPFSELENVYMTPHFAAFTQETVARRIEHLSENICRFMQDQVLNNQILT